MWDLLQDEYERRQVTQARYAMNLFSQWGSAGRQQ